jgi:hypothetical protein
MAGRFGRKPSNHASPTMFGGSLLRGPAAHWRYASRAPAKPSRHCLTASARCKYTLASIWCLCSVFALSQGNHVSVINLTTPKMPAVDAPAAKPMMPIPAMLMLLIVASTCGRCEKRP